MRDWLWCTRRIYEREMELLATDGSPSVKYEVKSRVFSLQVEWDMTDYREADWGSGWEDGFLRVCGDTRNELYGRDKKGW